jgi:enterochelin esterase-like enzyme
MNKSIIHHIHDSGRGELGLRYSVYLPSGYSRSRKRYNTLYLLHGAGDDEYGWICKGYVQQILNELNWEKSIIVMPLCFLKKSEMDEWRPPGRMDFQSFWFEELVPSVCKSYRVKNDGAYCAIAGLSIGAEQALDLAWCNKSDFAAICCMSPVFGREHLQAESLSVLHERWPYLSLANGSEALRLLYVTCADKDHLSIETSGKLSEVLKTLLTGKRAELINDIGIPGFHEWSFWRSGLKKFLLLMNKVWTDKP